MTSRSWRRLLLWACGSVLVLAAALCLVAAGVGWWLDCADAPRKADAIVVLGGGFSRPIYGADLYLSGLAPQVWISRILPDESQARLSRLGVALPLETDVNRAILLKKGVPARDIRLYGADVNSTREEALALARELDSRGKTILLVTSHFHARRARLVFRRELRSARVLVCPTPYETFDRRWWRHKLLAINALEEFCKLANFLAGSPFGRQP